MPETYTVNASGARDIVLGYASADLNELRDEQLDLLARLCEIVPRRGDDVSGTVSGVESKVRDLKRRREAERQVTADVSRRTALMNESHPLVIRAKVGRDRNVSMYWTGFRWIPTLADAARFSLARQSDTQSLVKQLRAISCNYNEVDVVDLRVGVNG